MKLWKEGLVWWYRFQVGNVRVKRSTGLANRGQAETMAIQALQEAQARGRGQTLVPTLGKIRQEWLEVNASTISAGHWRNVNSWDPHDLGDVKVDRLSTEIVEISRAQHLKGRSVETTNGWMRVLNLLCNWAIRRKLIPCLPYRLKMLKVQRKPKAILPLTLVKPWLEAVDAATRNPQVGVAVRLMLGLGLRESEALGARWEWVDWVASTYIPGRLVGGQFTTKGKEAVSIDVPQWLLDILLALRGDGPRLGLILPWKVLRDEGKGTETEIPHPSTFCRRAIAAANKVVGTEGVSVHRIRGTWITQHLRAGVPLKEVQRMARHKSEKTTLGYYEESREIQKKAQENLAKEMGLA